MPLLIATMPMPPPYFRRYFRQMPPLSPAAADITL